MNKVITFTAFFLLPFVTITAFAQYELPKFELPNDHIITYEITDADTDRSETEKAQGRVDAKNLFRFLLIGLLLFIAIVFLAILITLHSL